MTSPRISATDSQLVRCLLLTCRCVQWPSAVIVLGITSYFTHIGPRGLLSTYLQIISVISVAAFIPAFISPFISTRFMKEAVLLIDIIFSHLWLTGFIFTAIDYNEHACFPADPPGVGCPTKFAEEAFVFLTFIFTFFALFFEAIALWLVHREKYAQPARHEKHARLASQSSHNGTSTTHDNPEEATATPAQAV